MQVEAKYTIFWRNPPNRCKFVQKHMPFFFAYNTPPPFYFLLKTVKIDMTTYGSVQQVNVSWVDFECFMHFCESLYVFFSDSFFLFCFYRHFWPLFGALFGPFWPIKELFGTEMGSFWGDFGPFLGQSGVILSHLGFIVASFWHHFGVVLVSF